VKHVLYWCTIDGTSVASPLIASTFALAGGAHKVEYPAKTLYEKEVKSPGSLHDVTAGSNGECTKPFSETGLSGCTSTEESKVRLLGELACGRALSVDPSFEEWVYEYELFLGGAFQVSAVEQSLVCVSGGALLEVDVCEGLQAVWLAVRGR